MDPVAGVVLADPGRRGQLERQHRLVQPGTLGVVPAGRTSEPGDRIELELRRSGQRALPQLDHRQPLLLRQRRCLFGELFQQPHPLGPRRRLPRLTDQLVDGHRRPPLDVVEVIDEVRRDELVPRQLGLEARGIRVPPRLHRLDLHASNLDETTDRNPTSPAAQGK